MKKNLRFLSLLVLFFFSVLMILSTSRYHLAASRGPLSRVTRVWVTREGETKEETLPLTLKNLSPRTEVSVSFPFPEDGSDTLFFGCVYAPLTIAVDGEVLHTYGDASTYPSFFLDPPTQYDSHSLPWGEHETITLTYLSPSERESLSIHPPLLGTGRSILRYLMSHYGWSFFTALFFLFLGVILILASPFFLYLKNQNNLLLHLGLLCLFAGFWQVGENTLSVYLLQCPSLLYVLDFLGLFMLVIPLYNMGLSFLGRTWRPLLKAVNVLMQASVLLAILLQLSGRVSFHRSLYYFHILLPVAILLLPVCVLHEYLRYQNRTAGLFFVPFLSLTLSALLELINYRVRFFPQLSALFQIGLFCFILAMAAFSFFYLRDLYQLSLNSLKLENENKLQEQTITAQKKRNELLLAHFEEIRRERHDIRHHLRTLGEILSRGEVQNASSYIQSLSDSIPSYQPAHWCDNEIINATISFYAHQASQEGIRLTIRTQIPENNPHFSDANLCVVFGNLLENALEACRQVKGGSRFITLDAQVRREVLFIIQDNSYNGSFHMEDGRYYSSKRSGFGQGLLSIQSLAKAHDGAAHFQALENVFRSEVYFRL